MAKHSRRIPSMGRGASVEEKRPPAMEIPPEPPSKLLRVLYGLQWVGAVLVLAAATLIPITDADLFFHIKSGELFLKSGVPHADPFSFTRTGSPWMINAWLSEIILNALYWNTGSAGLIIFHTLMLGIAFGTVMVFGARIKASPSVITAAGALALIGTGYRYSARPELFTHVLVAVTLVIRYAYRLRGNPRVLILLPILSAVWANAHMGFINGMLIQGAFLTAAMIEALLGGGKGGPKMKVKPLALALGASVLATLLNPYTYKAWLFGKDIARDKGMRMLIEEWRPLIAQPFVGYVSLACLAALALLTLAAFYRGRRSFDLPGLILFLGFGIGSLSIRRLIVPSVLSAIVIIAVAWMQAGPLRLRRPRIHPAIPAGAVLVGLLLAAGLTHWVGISPWRPTGWRGLGIDPAVYPRGAAEYIAKRKPAGNMFNSMVIGGYLLWRLGPQTKVFIDGRIDMYGPELLKEYDAASYTPGAFEQVAEKYNIGYCVLIYPRGSTDLCTFLSMSPNWKLVFWDESSLVFVKNDAAHRKLIEEDEYQLLNPLNIGGVSKFRFRANEAQARLEMERIRRECPDGRFSQYTLGVAHFRLDEKKEARKCLERAIELDPGIINVYPFLAEIHWEESRKEEAFKILERALAIQPDNAMLNAQVSSYYMRLKLYEDALHYAKRAAELSPDSLPIAMTLAKLCALTKRIDDAIFWLQRCQAMAGPIPPEVLNVPEFDSIRSDPRFLSLQSPIGR